MSKQTTNLKQEKSTGLIYKLIESSNLDGSGRIKLESKFSLNYPEFRIKDSKFIGNPEDKFETMLFLPEGEDRKAEGGLRTKGYFKFSYKLKDGIWYICDLDGNPVKPAPEDIQNKILSYLDTMPNKEKIDELPLVSVITVVLNGEKYIEEAMRSVINQTYPNIEYIIIDGGSTDRTLDIIRKYEGYVDYWVSEKDNGIYDAMNKGTILANGLWLNYLNSDDSYSEDHVIEKVLFGVKSKYNAVIYGDNYILEGDALYLNKPNISKLKYKMVLGHPSVLFSSKCLKALGYYDVSFSINADYELIFRVFLSKLPMEYVNIPISLFRVHEGSTSYKYTLKGVYSDYIIHKRLNKYLAKLILILRIINFFLKRTFKYLKYKYNFGSQVVKVKKQKEK